MEELKLIDEQLEQIPNKYEIEDQLFVQFISREDYLVNDKFIQLLESFICNPKFKGLVVRLWDVFCEIVHENPKPDKFEAAYETFRECSITAWLHKLPANQFNVILAMKRVIDPATLKEFGFEFDTIKSLLLSNMKKLLIGHLKIICYHMYSVEIREESGNLDLTEYQHYCFGGCAICTLLRIYYASHVSEQLRFIMTTLI